MNTFAYIYIGSCALRWTTYRTWAATSANCHHYCTGILSPSSCQSNTKTRTWDGRHCGRWRASLPQRTTTSKWRVDCCRSRSLRRLSSIWRNTPSPSLAATTTCQAWVLSETDRFHCLSRSYTWRCRKLFYVTMQFKIVILCRPYCIS